MHLCEKIFTPESINLASENSTSRHALVIKDLTSRLFLALKSEDYSRSTAVPDYPLGQDPFSETHQPSALALVSKIIGLEPALKRFFQQFLNFIFINEFSYNLHSIHSIFVAAAIKLY